MSTLMILVGPNADSDPYLMDLASVAAGLAVESDRRVLFAGTSQTTLAVGTALVGNQQGRTVEGGERLPSPMVLFGLVRSVMDTPDPLYQDPGFNGDTQYNEGGLLLDLIDLGIMDLHNRMERRIVPKSIEDLASQVMDLLEQEKPSQALVIGDISGEMREMLSHHAEESNMQLKIIGDEELYSAIGPPQLDGVPIRSVERIKGEFRGETTSDPLVEAAENAVGEAGLNHAVTVWVLGKGQSHDLR